MKKLLLRIISILIYGTLSAQNNEVLTNETVTTLLSKGLSPSIIISKIKTSKTNFDVSIDALIKLKDQQVPDDVVNAMVEASGNKDNVQGNINDPDAVHESGIYYLIKQQDKTQMTFVEPTVCSQTKYGSGMLTSMTYGIAKTKTRAVIDGGMARLQLDDKKPVFYFYFDAKTNSLNSSSSWFTGSSSPNEFVLVKMDVKEKNRNFVIGSGNAYSGTTFGVDEDYKVAFDIEKVKPGVYKVTPKTEQLSGEYCFLFAGSTSAMGGGGQKVFDFGIK
jgi:hypothetical protein